MCIRDSYTGQANERALAFLNRFQGMVYLAVFGYYLRILLGKLKGVQAVSYTHLDVYKRQIKNRVTRIHEGKARTEVRSVHECTQKEEKW